MKVTTSLVEMETGQEGTVVRIDGGHGLTRRLEAMGIRPGVGLVKVSGPLLRGPVTVRVGSAQVAMGFGMAGQVVVETEEVS